MRLPISKKPISKGQLSAFLKNQNIKEVGILATSITINKGLYKLKLNAHGIKEVVPDSQDQAKLGQIIYNLVIGSHTNTDKRVFDKIIESLVKKEVESIILACTDLQLLTLHHHTKIKIFDTMQILVDATVEEMMK